MQKKIFVLDDDRETLSLLCDIIEDCGFFAISYSEGEKFFQANSTFDRDALLLLDLSMPGMDGIEVIRRLSVIKNPPQLILMSGHDTGILHSAVKLGRAHNLTIITSLDKPIRLSMLQQILLDYEANLKKIKKIELIINGDKTEPSELLDAILNEQMVLYYQPKIDIKTGLCHSCEGLIRWFHPDKGIIYPNDFISVAEKNGWMGQLTNWVLKKGIAQALIWKDLGININISLNVSADNITSLQLPEQVSNMLKDSKIDPKMITLEVTESALMGELITSLDILTRLRLKGIGLSIDDFGTGYSSLSQLHKIPFSELKVDQSFVISMLEDEEAKAIVKTCIMLGHELNMQVVAEGVESKEHFELLKTMGCDLAQGYYFSRPFPANEMLDFLNKNKTQQKG